MQRIFQEISEFELGLFPGAIIDVYTHVASKDHGGKWCGSRGRVRGRCGEDTGTAATSGRTNEIITIIIVIVIITIFLYLQHRNNMIVYDTHTHTRARYL